MKTTENNQQDNQETDSLAIAKSNTSESQKFILAIIILIVYLIFIAFMLYNSDVAIETNWNRMLYLFSGIEAIVFAALGYVFGKDIHRIRAEKAEENADQAKKETDKAKKETDNAKKTAEEEKIKGVKLSTAIFSRNTATTEDFSENLKGAFVAGSAIKNNAGDDYLVSLAKSLYASDSFTTVSFDYEISPADKINSITINGKTKSSSTGSYSGVLLSQNLFSIDVEKDSEFVEWTFKISRIIDSNGKKRKQSGGQLVSDRDSAYVQLENL